MNKIVEAMFFQHKCTNKCKIENNINYNKKIHGRHIAEEHNFSENIMTRKSFPKNPILKLRLGGIDNVR